MKKIFLVKIIVIIVILMQLMILQSCTKEDSSKNNTDKIQLWYYIDGNDETNKMVIEMIVDKSKEFCEKNNVSLDVHGYDSKTIEKKDYQLKRNIGIASGNAIVLDDIINMIDLIEQNADYTKLNMYDKLLNGFKNRHCIPIGPRCVAKYLENEIMEYYGVKPEKRIMTYTDYLKTKQEMKKKGARFALNNLEFYELIDNYLYENGVLFSEEIGELSKDNNKFKEILEKITMDVYNDIMLYYDACVKYDNEDSIIYDKNSELYLVEIEEHSVHSIFMPYSYNFKKISLSDKSFMISLNNYTRVPTFFIYKKITNDKIYDLANYIFSEENYLAIIKFANYIPILDTKKIRVALKINDKLEFTGDYGGSLEARESVETAYEMLFSDEEKSKEIADFQFYDSNKVDSIAYFVKLLILDLARESSGDKLSLKECDLEDENIKKLITEKTDEFILNFSIYND